MTSLDKTFHFTDPNDKPLMKSLLQLRNMKLIDVEWESGDIRYISEPLFCQEAFECKGNRSYC